MTAVLKNIGISSLLVFVYLLGFFMMSTMPKASAQVSGESRQNTQAEKATDDYSYVAQAGDTYTQMARKAIQTYGINENVNLSQAKIIFAETNLTREAGSPELNRGAKVDIKKDTVKKWVEAAQKISGAQEALWAKYVPRANFSTDKIGESR